MQETADQYRQRLFSYINGSDPLKRLAAAPAKLARLLKVVSPAVARKRPAPGDGRSRKLSRISPTQYSSEATGFARFWERRGAGSSASIRMPE
jgi:hypothetical protein